MNCKLASLYIALASRNRKNDILSTSKIHGRAETVDLAKNKG